MTHMRGARAATQVMCRTYSRSTCQALRRVHGLLSEQAAQLDASVAEVRAGGG